MSTIVLSPNASGTGAFTIAAPNSNTNRTLTLPDETGTVTTSASTPTFTGAVTAPAFIPNSSSVPTNGLYLPATNTPAWASNSTKVVSVIKGSSLALEGATPQTGTGITFPATQSASTDANTLDDYEEGTWTPTDGSGASLSITFNNPTYTKIGRLVFVRCSTIVYPSTASGAAAVVGGLPFTSATGDVGSQNLVSTNTYANRALVSSGTTTVYFYANASVSASSNANLSTATIYGFSAVYTV